MLLLNYRPVLDQPTGIGIYANAVLPALQSFEHSLIAGGGSGGGTQRLKRLAWSQFQLPRVAKKRKADFIFTPAPEGYLGEQVVPQILMVHDLRPLSHPERSMQSLYFRNWVPPLLNQCAHILTNSSFTASEIRQIPGIAEAKISVTPLGYDSSHFYPTNTKKIIHDRPYLLHIGQAYPHKNIYRLIQAFGIISKSFPQIDLILAGKPHPTETRRLTHLISRMGISDRVIHKNYVSYKDLPDLYRGALCFIYPSLWEGFGLPIIEAMACGCPVITSHGSGMEEAARGSALLVDPLQTEQISDAIRKILLSSQFRLQLRSAGLDRVNACDWETCKKTTFEVLTQIMNA